MKLPFKLLSWNEEGKLQYYFLSEYNELLKITTNIIKELGSKKIIIARRFSDKYNHRIELVHEAISILEPFYNSSSDSFKNDQLDNLYEFPKEITEASRILFSIGRRDVKLEYQHKTLKIWRSFQNLFQIM